MAPLTTGTDMRKLTKRLPNLGRALGLAGYVALCLLYLTWVWTDELTDLGGDSAMYMLMARHLSPFFPASPAVAEAVRTAAYPPLFPLMIGLCGGSMLAGHLIVIACFLAALLVLFLWLRSEGMAWPTGFWLTAVFALMPGTYLLTLNIWTENPYLLFSLITVLALHRAESGNEPSQRALLAATVATALATLTRAASLPLLTAFALHLVLTRPRNWLQFLAVGAAPFVIWAAIGRSHQSGFSSYLAQWNERYGHDAPYALMQQLAAEWHWLRRAWVEAWASPGGFWSPLRYPALAIGIICLAGCLRRLLQRRFDALYVAFYSVLLLAWPFPAEAPRLEYVLGPLLLAQGAMLVQAGGTMLHHVGGKRLLPAFLGMLSILTVPSLLLTGQRYLLPPPSGLTLVKHTAEWYEDARLNDPTALLVAVNLKAMREIGKQVGSGDCVFSVKPSVVTLYSGRSSYAPPPATADEASFELGMTRCRYAYPMALASPSFPGPFYPMNRSHQHGQMLINAVGGDENHRNTYGALIDLGIERPSFAPHVQ